MIKKFLTGFLVFISMWFSAFGQVGMEVSIMTYNLRYDNPADGVNAWDNRKVRLTDFILEQKPDILDVQEALISQMTYLQSRMSDYSYAGVGRDDGKEKGEFSAIFYNNKLFRLLDKGNFWLSETPEVPGSMGWDAACTRICSWAKLQNIKTKTEFYVFNTHWDHIGVKARENSALLIKERILKIAGKRAVILTGDFNCSFDSPAIQYLIKDPHWLQPAVTQTKPQGPDFSYAGFKVGGEKGELIDHVFISAGIKATSYRVFDNSFEGNYLSDHFPVLVKISIPK